MAGKKISVEFDVQEDLVKMLEYAAEKYKLGDKSKALRCLLDFAAMDGDWDVLFKQIRCVRCLTFCRQVQGYSVQLHHSDSAELLPAHLQVLPPKK
tara:strand:+ start:1484 stop:1771 length:288 start_codon:yes stop_codon:yes gene_type:complete